jgi:hypothetical protein
MPSPMYHNIINFIFNLSVKKCPSKFINIAMWEHFNFDSDIFGCGKVDYSNSIIIANLEDTPIPNRWFKIIFPTYVRIKISLQNFLLGI